MVPSARLQVVARQGEDPFQWRLQSAQPEFIIDAHGNVGIGTHEPTDKLAVLQEGDGRAAFFSLRSANHTAAVSAITNGTGSAVFANIINPNSTSPALFARNSGSGPAAQFDRGDVRFLNGNVGVGAAYPERKLTVRDGRHQVAIVDSDNNDKTWTLTSHQETGGMGLWEDGNQGRLVVTAGGRVGIGTTNPNHELVIQANDRAVQVRDDTSDNSPNHQT